MSIVIRSPSRASAIVPPAAASGDTWPLRLEAGADYFRARAIALPTNWSSGVSFRLYQR